MRIDDFRNFTEYQYYEFFKIVSKTDEEFEFSNGMYTAYSGEQLLGSMEALGIKTSCLYGTGVVTTDRLHWLKRSKFPDYTPYEEATDGDGTVPEWSSAGVCKKWKKEQIDDVDIIPLLNTDHVGTLWHSDTLGAIARMTGLDDSKLKLKKGVLDRKDYKKDEMKDEIKDDIKRMFMNEILEKGDKNEEKTMFQEEKNYKKIDRL